MSISLILVILAIILAVIDLALGLRQTARAWSLTPIAVILLGIAMVIGSGAIHG